jgi:hypothetical protein
VLKHTVNCIKVFLRFVVQLLRLRLQLLEASLRINIYGILCVFTDIELGLEVLRRLLLCQSVVADHGGKTAR